MEANRRLHFVSVVKKMRQAWGDGATSRVGLDTHPHHPREQCQRPRSPHPFTPEMQPALKFPGSGFCDLGDPEKTSALLGMKTHAIMIQTNFEMGAGNRVMCNPGKERDT